MSAEVRKDEPKKRKTATEAASRVASMVKQMMADVRQSKLDGKKIAYTFITANYDEIIRAMDVVPHFVENYAGICGAKRDAQRFLEKAEAENLSRSLCTYALCGVGFDSWREEIGQMPPEAPWGGQVKPDMMIGTGQAMCDPRNKWFQACQHYTQDVPIFDAAYYFPPFERDYDYREVQDYYVKYMVEQFRGLVEFLEKQTGRKMNWDRLSELVELVDRTWDLVWETYDLRRAVPCPMDTGDAMNTMVPLWFMLGTKQSYDYFLGLREELTQKIARKEGVVADEKYRILWGGGLPSWFALSDFNYFNSKGAVFPCELSYRTFESTRNFDIDLSKIHDPLEHIAWRIIKYQTHWYDAARKRPNSHPDVERLIQYIEEYKLDGVVMHETFSCRSMHVGLIWQLNLLKKVYRDIPSLVLESDIIDISSYNEADTHLRIDAFINTLERAKNKK